MPAQQPPESPALAARGAYGITLIAALPTPLEPNGATLAPGATEPPSTLAADTWAGLPPAPPDWPVWTLERRLPRAPGEQPTTHVSEATADLALFHGGTCLLDRAARTITLHVGAGEPPRSIVHPWLSGAFAVTTLWAGSLALHGGVCLIGDRAWVLFGIKGSGKSTTLAALARAGVPVLSDDLAAIAGDRVLLGPRYIDLRRTAAALFPDAEPVGRLGLRHRWRLPLGDAPASAQLGGFVVMDWSEEFGCTDVPVPERLPLILGSGTLPVAPADPGRLLDLIGLPVVRAARPRSLDQLDAWVRFLTEQLAARAG